jgi:uncharacterized membrane protein (DUF441 family)
MTNEELLIEWKKGLNMPTTSTNFDGTLTQKILLVKSYMKGAGVSDEMMLDDLAVGIIVLGVTDLWNLTSGDVKFSTVFNTLLTQLSIRSLPSDS